MFYMLFVARIFVRTIGPVYTIFKLDNLPSGRTPRFKRGEMTHRADELCCSHPTPLKPFNFQSDSNSSWRSYVVFCGSVVRNAPSIYKFVICRHAFCIRFVLYQENRWRNRLLATISRSRNSHRYACDNTSRTLIQGDLGTWTTTTLKIRGSRRSAAKLRQVQLQELQFFPVRRHFINASYSHFIHLPQTIYIYIYTYIYIYM